MRGVALAVAALFVLGWRATGLWLAEDPRTLAVALTLLGLLNLACGLYVVRTVRSRAARVFAAQALCQGLHWGGQLALADEQWKLAADLFYVIVAVVLTQCLFVLLACEPALIRAGLGASGEGVSRNESRHISKPAASASTDSWSAPQDNRPATEVTRTPLRIREGLIIRPVSLADDRA